MFQDSNDTNFRVHNFRLQEQLQKSLKYHALTYTTERPAKQPSQAKRLAIRLFSIPARRTLAPQH